MGTFQKINRLSLNDAVLDADSIEEEVASLAQVETLNPESYGLGFKLAISYELYFKLIFLGVI